MLILMHMVKREEEVAMAEGLKAAANLMWDWDQDELANALAKCNDVLISNGGRLTCWFTDRGMQFDFNVPQ